VYIACSTGASTGDEAVSIACGIVVGAVPFTSNTDAGEVPFI